MEKYWLGEFRDSLSDIHELICLLNLAKINNDQKIRARVLLIKISDYDLLFNIVEQNGIGILFAQRAWELENLIEFPIQFKNKLLILDSQIKKQRERTRVQLEFLETVLVKLSQNGIKVILLKGALFSNNLYDIKAYKKMNDIDILVKLTDAWQASVNLRELGLTCAESLFGKEKFSESTHHSPPFINEELKLVVGLHWGIHSVNAVWKSDITGIWQRKIPFKLAGITAYKMSTEDNLLHLCIHLPFYKIGLRELGDIYNLITFSSPPINWKVFKERVVQWNAYEPVYRALSLVNAFYFNFLENNELIDICKKKSKYFCIHDTNKRILSENLLLVSRSTHITKIEKSFIAFRAINNYFERVKYLIKTWTLTFAPPEIEVRKISGNMHKKSSISYFLARLLTPFYIVRALVLDHGLKVIMFLTIQNILIVLKDTITFSFLKRKTTKISNDMKSLLEVLE